MLKFLLLLFVGTILFLSCNIEDEVEAPVSQTYQQIFATCGDLWSGGNAQIIINNQWSMDSMVVRHFQGCEYPAIDFEKYSVVGVQTVTGGCKRPGSQVTVTRDNGHRKIFVRYKVIQRGNCDSFQYGGFWIVVPKISSQYSVRFERRDTTVSN